MGQAVGVRVMTNDELRCHPVRLPNKTGRLCAEIWRGRPREAVRHRFTLEVPVVGLQHGDLVRRDRVKFKKQRDGSKC